MFMDVFDRRRDPTEEVFDLAIPQFVDTAHNGDFYLYLEVS